MHRECFLGLSKFFSKKPDGSIIHMFEKIIEKYGIDFIDKSNDLIKNKYAVDYPFYSFIDKVTREGNVNVWMEDLFS